MKTCYRLVTASLLLATSLHAQNSTPTTPSPADALSREHPFTPLSQPALTTAQLELINLEVKFQQDVAKGGGSAFSSWFADDAVSLSDGQPPVIGKAAIAASAVWDPKVYQLTWYAEGERMMPSNDNGFTWGHYDAQSKDKNGQPVTLSGRYITFWKKVDGAWKVALDASAKDAPAAGDCCKLPTP